MSNWFFLSGQQGQTPQQNINLWVTGCPHCPADTLNGRSSITEAINQTSGQFTYDAALMLGDFESDQDAPDVVGNASQGEDCAGQLNNAAVREKIYTIAGNHDGGDGEMDWFLRYIDPLGENTAYSGVNPSNMPYQQVLMEAGSWHSYYITIGNIRIFMLSDRNELPYPWGRKDAPVTGGVPSGTLTVKTWNWVKSTMESRTDLNYIICTHANPRLTTIATPDGDRLCGNHGPSGYADGSGSLYSLYDEDTPANTEDATGAYLQYFADNPDHRCVMWLGSHTHTYLNQSCGTGSRTIKWTENGVQFLNIAQLTGYHGGQRDPKSWLFNINNIRINMKMWLHRQTQDTLNEIGWYEPQEFNVNLKV